MNFHDMGNISFTIKFLMALSVFSLAFYLEKLWVIISLGTRTARDLRSLVPHIGEGGGAAEPVEKLFDAMVAEKSIPIKKNPENLLFHYGAETDAMIERIKASISKLGSIAVLSPYIGLFGTVIGIMEAFSQIAKSGSSNFAVVSKGISEALVATAAGLLLAIIASFLYNHLTARIRLVQCERDLLAEKIGNELKNRGR